MTCLQGVIDLDRQISNGALQLRMAGQQLSRPRVHHPAVDETATERAVNQAGLPERVLNIVAAGKDMSQSPARYRPFCMAEKPAVCDYKPTLLACYRPQLPTSNGLRHAPQALPDQRVHFPSLLR